MSEELELKLLREIKLLREENNKLKGITENKIPHYQYSKLNSAIELNNWNTLKGQ